MLEPSRELAAWLRRLPHYLYVADLVADRRVLELDCGAGFGAYVLANRGATRVVGVDRDPVAVGEARTSHRLVNLEYRCENPDALELEDATFDLIFVPDGAEHLRRRSVLMEL